MNKHPHIEVITAWYNGATVQWRFGPHKDWRTIGEYGKTNPPAFDPKFEYRIKPEPTCKLELTKNEVEALWKLFEHHGHHFNVIEPLKSIGRKLNAVEYTE